MNLKTKIVFLLFFATIAGCATPEGSMATGAAAGAALGAGAGAIAANGQDEDARIKNVVIGTAAGGVLGAISGHVLHEQSQEKADKAYGQGRQAGQAAGTSTLFRGNTCIPVHFECRVVQESQWSK